MYECGYCGELLDECMCYLDEYDDALDDLWEVEEEEDDEAA